jgi:hypothetical protein
VVLVGRLRELGWVVGPVGTALMPALAPFVRQKTVLLTTYRRDGTPVSITVDGDRACVRSFERARKTRRIRNNPAVTVPPSTARGTPTSSRSTPPHVDRPGRVHPCRSGAGPQVPPMLHGVLVPLAHRAGRRRTGRTVHFELAPFGAAASAGCGTGPAIAETSIVQVTRHARTH